MIREIVLDDGGMNLLSSGMLRSLREQLPYGQLLVLRLTRSGGADMNEMARFTAAEAEEFARLGQETFDAIERLPFLTVVAIDGDCFGGALDLALAFDLRYATPRSRFSHPGAKLGIVTGFGGTSRWRKAITPAVARRLFLANEVLTAPDAHALGLIDALGEPDLERLAALDPGVVRMLKELSRHAGRLSQREVMLLAETLGQIYLPAR
jgi:enoyl-CoA hydratase/carnithine racemase